MNNSKNILLGVTGSIAAYKAAFLIRLLIQKGARVKVIMTPSSKEFITPLTLSALSKNPVHIDFFDPGNGSWDSHVDLGHWADAFVIAPASANTIAKMAHGMAENLLLTTYLSARCAVYVAPAMDLDMLQHPSTQHNLNILTEYGNIIMEPAVGELASGLEGKGRMAEPDEIVNRLYKSWSNAPQQENNSVIAGKTILITAGPTREPIDPVRYISNYSSGKMGYALAEKLADQGARIILVSGPTHLHVDHPNIQLVDVQTAEEMKSACDRYFPTCDGAIMAAAVADYKPSKQAGNKIKRNDDALMLEFVANPDISRHLGVLKKENQFLAGFALESENEQENARQKLQKKNFDFIVLNSLQDEGAGFHVDTNKISIMDKHNNFHKFELKNKSEVASDIVQFLEKYLSS